jgi:hypothetical protein
VGSNTTRLHSELIAVKLLKNNMERAFYMAFLKPSRIDRRPNVAQNNIEMCYVLPLLAKRE